MQGMMSFTDATEALLRYLSSRGCSDKTIQGYSTDLKMFWLEMKLDKLSLDDLETNAALWLNSRRQFLSPKTTGRRLTTMRNLGSANGRPILRQYNAPTPARPIPHPLPGGKDDLIRLLDVCNTEEHTILVLLLGMCGMRISEALSAKPTHFNYGDQTVTIRGKGDRTRIVPVNRYAWAILLPLLVGAQLSGRKYLVPMADRTARKLITELGKRAGILRPISSHDLRATFATAAYRLHHDIRAVQELLGHANVKQTEVYTGVTEDEMRRSAEFMEDDD